LKYPETTVTNGTTDTLIQVLNVQFYKKYGKKQELIDSFKYFMGGARSYSATDL
jgi:hypothetical protein